MPAVYMGCVFILLNSSTSERVAGQPPNPSPSRSCRGPRARGRSAIVPAALLGHSPLPPVCCWKATVPDFFPGRLLFSVLIE